MGLFSGAKKLLSGETISFEKTTHTDRGAEFLTGDRQRYVGRWVGANTVLLIRPDGTVDYRRKETIGDTTNTEAVSGPIDSFEGPSFVVGVLGNNRQFDVSEPPSVDAEGRTTMTVNGERLHRE